MEQSVVGGQGNFCILIRSDSKYRLLTEDSFRPSSLTFYLVYTCLLELHCVFYYFNDDKITVLKCP